MLHTFTCFASWLVKEVSSIGYPGIAFLMFLESSFIPFPSEIVMIPAGYAASQGSLDIYLVILSGLLGSLMGALFNYYLGRTLGRKFLAKWGRYMLIDNDKLAKTEEFFNIHGDITTFVGRLIPGVRQYISFPPGIGKMNVKRFIIFTLLGAGLWVTILALLGYFIGENQHLISQYLHEITASLIIFSVVLVVAYVIIRRRKN